ncbi:MAG: hypothetical protein HYV34_02955 [Candidatus Kerfeldbacteria bacterium]|nr:hypothetical protein [Candidatus Kerfeldbacteria bacterium]
MIPLIRTENKKSDLYLVLPDVGTEVQRETPDRDEQRVVRSPSGKFIAFSTFDDPFWSVWIAESNGAESRVSEGKLEVVDFALSPDDKALFLLERGSEGILSGSVIRIASKERQRIASDIQEARWLRDGRGIATLSKNEKGQSELAIRLRNLDGTFGEPTALSSAVWSFVGETGGSAFLVFAEFDGVLDLATLDSTGTLARVGNISLPKTTGVTGELSADSTSLVYALDDQQSGQKLLVYSLASKTSQTISENGFDVRIIDESVLYKEVQGSTTTVMVYDLRSDSAKRVSEKDGLTY